jgi:hypothetical protein
MIRRFLRLFPYVQDLEARLLDLETERTSERHLVDSMNRYIEQLESLKRYQAETIEALRADRDQLKKHPSGGRP